jgi:MFS transporter, DHA1 family, inner membrane transport protein
MGIFVNRRFNLIYVHAGMQAFAAYGGEAFVFVYLLKAGLSVPVVLASISLMFLSRLVFRTGVLPLVKRLGLRNALALGIVAEGLSYQFLAHITAADGLLLAYLAVWAASSSLYWTTYHAYVVLIGDGAHRGQQVSAMEFIGTLIGIAAPIAAGLMLTWFPPALAFGIVGLVMAGSALPLLFLPNLQIAPDVAMPRETQRQARLMMFTDGLRAGWFHFTWLIALFISLGSSFAAYGGTLSLAGAAGAVAGLFLGKSIDLGKGRRAVQIGFAVLAVAALARTLGYPAAWSAVLANAAAAVAWPLYATAFNTRVYALAQSSPCPLRFHIVAEGGWDLGTGASCLIAALLLHLGFSFVWPLGLGVLACALGYRVMVASFERRAEDLSPVT